MTQSDPNQVTDPDLQGWIQHERPGWRRQPMRTNVLIVIGAGIVYICLGAFLLTRPDVRHDAYQLIPSGILLVISGIALFRRLKGAAVRLEVEGVRVRGVRSTRLIPWSEIEAFTFIRPVMRVQLKNGREVLITGIRSSKHEDSVDALTSRFNAELERRTGQIVDPIWMDPRLSEDPFALIDRLIRPKTVRVVGIVVGAIGIPTAVVAAIHLSSSAVVALLALVGVFVPPPIMFLRLGPRRVLERPGAMLRLILRSAIVVLVEVLLLQVRSDLHLLLMAIFASGLCMVALLKRPLTDLGAVERDGSAG